MQTELRLFGLDLAPAWHECRAAWRSLWQRLLPVGHDLQQVQARLVWPDGAVAGWQQGQRCDEPTADARVVALVMPADRLLERLLRLSGLSAAELQQAAHLEVQASSPFGMPQTVWSCLPVPEGVQVVMASREHCLAELARQGLDPGTTEVWAAAASGSMLVLPGFGEQQRERQARQRGLLHGLGGGLALAVLLAIAVTPTAQLRLQAIEAVQSLDALAAQAGPALAAREALVQATTLAQRVQAQQAQSVPVLSLLQTLTQVIPDDTVLQSVQSQGGTVRLVGQSPNAAELMRRLGEVPGFANVRAPSPATRPPGATRESFTIELDRVVLPAAADVVSASVAGTAAPSVPDDAASRPGEAAQ